MDPTVMLSLAEQLARATQQNPGAPLKISDEGWPAVIACMRLVANRRLATFATVDSLVLDIGKAFPTTFGVGSQPSTWGNPIAAALADKPLAFGGGTDVRKVVEFILDRALLTEAERLATAVGDAIENALGKKTLSDEQWEDLGEATATALIGALKAPAR